MKRVVLLALATLTACGSSHAASPSSSHSSDTAGAENSPVGVVQRFADLLIAKNATAACALVTPRQESMCTWQFAPMVSMAKISGMTVHYAVVSGDHALVSVTGRMCVGSVCEGATDPASGMPSPTLSFAAAWAKAAQSPTTAASPCERVNGTWYVVIN